MSGRGSGLRRARPEDRRRAAARVRAALPEQKRGGLRGPDTRRLVIGAVALAGVLALCATYLVTVVLKQPLVSSAAKVSVELPRTGGLFEGSAVSYRGVRVGTVTDMRLGQGGAVAEVTLRDGAEVPRDTTARVRSLSPVGEQYLDLRPSRHGEPFLSDGDVLRAGAEDLPVSLAQAVGNVDRLLGHVDHDDVRVVLRELAAATEGSGEDLRDILDSGDRLVSDLDRVWPETARLLRSGEQIGETFAARSDELGDLSRSAQTLAAWLKDFDPEFRQILRRSPGDLDQVSVLVRDLGKVLPPFLAEMIGLGQMGWEREPHLRALPAALRHGGERFSSAFTDGWLNIDLLLQGQKQCDYPRPRHSPMETERRPLYRDGHCTLTDQVWRGAEHAPPPVPRPLPGR